MSRSHRVSATFLPALLYSLLLLLPGCAADRKGPELTIQLPETEAGAALGAALAQARSTDRNVFVHTGADW